MATVEIGDRVRFKTKLPDRKETDAQHGAGWDGEQEIKRTWSDQFGGADGVVDVTDPINNEVRVRGRDAGGVLFTVWIDPRYLTVTEEGIR
jgi:hypothetical protein